LPSTHTAPCVVLMHEQVDIAPLPPADILIRHLPCHSVKLHWLNDALALSAASGAVSVEQPPDNSKTIRKDIRIRLVGTLTTAELIERSTYGLPDSDELSWSILNPYAVWSPL